MSLYNAIMGFNPACVALLPMLGRTQDEYPRFRDCFLSDDGKRIVVYTRVGGGNRHWKQHTGVDSEGNLIYLDSGNCGLRVTNKNDYCFLAVRREDNE